MGLLNLALEETPDLVLPTEGQHQLVVEKMEFHDSKESGKTSLKVVFRVADQPNCYNVTKYFGLPTDDDEIDSANSKRRAMKSFCQAANIDLGTFQQCFGERQFSSLLGSAVWATIKLGKYQDEDRAEIGKFIIA